MSDSLDKKPLKRKKNKKNHKSGAVTIKDVALHAGVSTATVSRVLNNFSFVKEKYRIRVREAVKKLNYSPNVFARRLAGGQINAIGLIIPGFEGVSYSFFAQQVIRSVGLTLERSEKDLFLHMFWEKDNFNTNYVEGVIFADIIRNESQLERVVNENIPCIVINRQIDDLPVSFVSIDNEQGSYQAVRYLIDLGHKRIAHISGGVSAQCSLQRTEGFKLALKDADINIPDYFLQPADFSRASARKAIDNLMNYRYRPTAVFCASDDMAYEVMMYLIEKGIEVPKDISIIGFDNNYEYFRAPLRLTTVEQPVEEMSREAVKALDKLIMGRERRIKKVLPTRLIIGETTSPVSHISE